MVTSFYPSGQNKFGVHFIEMLSIVESMYPCSTESC